MAAPPFLCDISVASPGGKYKGRGKSIKFNAPIRCGMGVPFLTLRRESCLKNMPWAGGGSVLPLASWASRHFGEPGLFGGRGEEYGS